MNLKLLDPPDNNISSNIEILDILNKELCLLKSLFFEALENIETENQLIEQEIQIDGLPESVLSVNTNSENITDIAPNLHLKSFFFVYRQATSKILELFYLLNRFYQVTPGGRHFPNASKNDQFKRFIESLVNDEFDNYDETLINLLKDNRDAFIISRIIRNRIKSLGVFNVYSIDGFFRIVIPLGDNISRDEASFQYIMQDFSLPNNEIKNFNWDPCYLNELYYTIILFTDEIKAKYKSIL